MKNNKFDLTNLSDVFSLDNIKDITITALAISEDDFNQNFTRAPVLKKVRAETSVIDHGHSSRGKGNSGRQWLTPNADALVTEWYRSRNPAWLYTHPDYFWEGLACSWETSASFVAFNLVKELKYPRYNRHPSMDPKTLTWKVFDWGAGVGLTTLLLAKAMPLSEIFYVQTPCSKEFLFFQEALKRSGLTNITILSSESELPSLDMVVGIEIVEHFQKPMQALMPILNHVKVGGLFAHSSYWQSEMNMPTLGHFLEYDFEKHGIKSVKENMSVYHAFRKCMDDAGWDFTDRDPWQHKPRFYKRREISSFDDV